MNRAGGRLLSFVQVTPSTMLMRHTLQPCLRSRPFRRRDEGAQNKRRPRPAEVITRAQRYEPRDPWLSTGAAQGDGGSLGATGGVVTPTNPYERLAEVPDHPGWVGRTKVGLDGEAARPPRTALDPCQLRPGAMRVLFD